MQGLSLQPHPSTVTKRNNRKCNNIKKKKEGIGWNYKSLRWIVRRKWEQRLNTKQFIVRIHWCCTRQCYSFPFFSSTSNSIFDRLAQPLFPAASRSSSISETWSFGQHQLSINSVKLLKILFFLLFLLLLLPWTFLWIAQEKFFSFVFLFGRERDKVRGKENEKKEKTSKWRGKRWMSWHFVNKRMFYVLTFFRTTAL